MKPFTRTEVALRQVIRVECVRAEDVTAALAAFDAGEGMLLKETIGPPLKADHDLQVKEGWFDEPGLARAHYTKLHALIGREDLALMQRLLDFIDDQVGAEGLDEAPDDVQQAYGLLVDILNPEGIAEDGSSANGSA